MQKSLKIRKAESAEIKQLQVLNDLIMIDNPKFDSDLMPDWGKSEQGRRYFQELLNNKSAICFVAEEQGALVGYVAARPKDFGHRLSKYVELENLGVIPEYQNQGIGKKLYGAFVTWAKKQGFEKVYLASYFANSKARGFYENIGFNPIDIAYEKNL